MLSHENKKVHFIIKNIFNAIHPRVSYIHFLSKIFCTIKSTRLFLFSCDDVLPNKCDPLPATVPLFPLKQ